MTLPRFPTASTTARQRATFSSSESVGLSPVVPVTTSPSDPLSRSQAAIFWAAPSSTRPSEPNGVTMAVTSPPNCPFTIRSFPRGTALDARGVSGGLRILTLINNSTQKQQPTISGRFLSVVLLKLTTMHAPREQSVSSVSPDQAITRLARSQHGVFT